MQQLPLIISQTVSHVSQPNPAHAETARPPGVLGEQAAVVGHDRKKRHMSR